jgi:hypothetical protein
MLPRPAALAAAALVAGAAVLAGCASGPTLRTDYDRHADFSAYRTYGYVEPFGTDREGYRTIVTQHFKDAIDAEMTARGYRRAESPDLLINVAANAKEQADVRSTPAPEVGVGFGWGHYYGYRGGLYGAWPLYRTDVETVRYKVGTANVARRKQMVWEGVAEGRLSEAVMKDPGPAIRSVIHQLFERFPGRATPAP